MTMTIDDERWIFERPLAKDFFRTAGTFKGEEADKRFAEIPDRFKPAATVMIQSAIEGAKTFGKMDCLKARTAIFFVYKAMEEQKKDLRIPYYWSSDGIMIEPEWIVRITNGLVGWSCKPGFDDPDQCGLTDCIYRGLKK